MIRTRHLALLAVAATPILGLLRHGSYQYRTAAVIGDGVPVPRQDNYLAQVPGVTGPDICKAIPQTGIISARGTHIGL